MGLAETTVETKKAFEDVYLLHRLRVFNLCRYLLGSSDAAEDATHEVFLRAQTKFSTYDPSKPMSTWLAGIASHLCIDQLRRRSVEKRLFDTTPIDEYQLASPGRDPLGEFLSAERGAQVRDTLAALADRYRVPLILAYYSEFGYAEIAELLGVSKNRVGTLIFRGKQELRQQLKRSNRSGLSE